MPEAGTLVAPFRDEGIPLTGGNLIQTALAAQATLDTAVTRFSSWHETHSEDDDSEPHQARHYRHLIPTSKPQVREQYAFEVQLDECTGCKACVTACHSLNGLDEDESWRDVGSIVTRDGSAYQQTITTACHHCEDPACANGCPVLAYEKDADTGIVHHLDDQCIGCSYCMLKCPYEVPKFNKRLGIVRKCDMCTARLAEGEAPACVQACPNGAIGIRIIRRDQPVDAPIVPGAVTSTYTRPTTSYVTKKAIPAVAVPADAAQLRVEPTHMPLVVMLVLTQVAAGLFIAAGIASSMPLTIAGNILLQIGLAASILHLGQPLRAWRAFLGWRKSWLSREIIVFSAFAGAGAAALLPALPFIAPYLPPSLLSFLSPWLAVPPALLGVFCSVMVYVDTLRPDWRMSATAGRFFGTTAIATACGLTILDARWTIFAGTLMLAKLLWSGLPLLKEPESYASRMHRDALPTLTLGRFILGALALMLLFVSPLDAMPFVLLAELAERTLYFKTVRAWRMPGL